MVKTVVVAVEWRQRHSLYRKSMRRISKFSVHDEENMCHVGDQVRIVESRPLSKTKRWRVVEILARHEVPEVQPKEIDGGLEAELVAPTLSVAVAGKEPEVPVAEVEEAEEKVEPTEAGKETKHEQEEPEK